MTLYEEKRADFKKDAEECGYTINGVVVPDSGYWAFASGWWEGVAKFALNRCENLQAKIDKLEGVNNGE